MKWLWNKTINFFKWIWKQCKDIKTLLLFLFYWLLLGSPTWIGYALYFITENKWHLTYSNACLLFWSGPGTPMCPLAIGLALGTRKIFSILKRRKSKYEISRSVPSNAERKEN